MDPARQSSGSSNRASPNNNNNNNEAGSGGVPTTQYQQTHQQHMGNYVPVVQQAGIGAGIGAMPAMYGMNPQPATPNTYETVNTTTTTSGVEMSSENVRIVSGQERIIEVKTIVGEEFIKSQRVEEKRIPVKKKIVFEEIIEKIMVIPETVYRTEYVEEFKVIKETTIEVAKPTIQETHVEVLETEIHEVPVVKKQKRVEEKIVEKPVYITMPRPDGVSYVPKVMEIPEQDYHVNYTAEGTKVLRYACERNIPKPLELITTIECQAPKFRPHYHKLTYPVIIPIFTEVAVRAELFDAATIAKFQGQCTKLEQTMNATIQTKQAISACKVEELAGEVGSPEVQYLQDDAQAAITQVWTTKSLHMATGASMSSGVVGVVPMTTSVS